MSLEEDTELRDLVTQALEDNGSLAKIRVNEERFTFVIFSHDIFLLGAVTS